MVSPKLFSGDWIIIISAVVSFCLEGPDLSLFILLEKSFPPLGSSWFSPSRLCNTDDSFPKLVSSKDDPVSKYSF